MKFLELPRLGETMEEGELLVWIKKAGETVKRGETIAEIQTDKIVAEMPALEDFVLEELLVQEGEVVKVGQALARIRGVGEAANSSAPASNVATSNVAGSSAVSSIPASSEAERAAVVMGAQPVHTAEHGADPSGRVRASPAARRVARELSVKLETVMGTGPRGRVTTEDVRATAKARISSKKTPSDTVFSQSTNTVQDDGFSGAADTNTEFHRFTRLETATGKATSQSKREMPHFYVRTRVDLTGFMRGLEIQKTRSINATVNDGVVKAAALALKQHPRLNTMLEDDGVRLLSGVHIGIITATPEGLVTSVVRNANTLGLSAINARVKDVRARAAAGRARADDVTGATFCVSNLGMFGIEEFSAIILPPNVAILAVGAVQDEVIAHEGAIRIARMARLTVSADHRALDGVEVALFLQTLRQMLENPDQLFQDPFAQDPFTQGGSS
jgi:pyruvate dehydrogenase E2 component (dihydrolipoamide acetyltransferase)